jgi:hypothetical protein
LEKREKQLKVEAGSLPELLGDAGGITFQIAPQPPPPGKGGRADRKLALNRKVYAGKNRLQEG